MGRQNVCWQVTETSHKEVKRKGSRTNRNPVDALDKSDNLAYRYVYVCIRLYPSDLVAGEQGPTATRARHQGSQVKKYHPILIPTIFCPLYAIRRARRRERRKGAWPPGCAAACRRARNPLPPVAESCIYESILFHCAGLRLLHPAAAHYRGTRDAFIPSIDDCWTGLVNLLFKVRVSTSILGQHSIEILRRGIILIPVVY